MKYILIWWIIMPHHAQKIHMEEYPTLEACHAAEQSIPPDNTRHHCSIK
jgi:hypothetical protein